MSVFFKKCSIAYLTCLHVVGNFFMSFDLLWSAAVLPYVHYKLSWQCAFMPTLRVTCPRAWCFSFLVRASHIYLDSFTCYISLCDFVLLAFASYQRLKNESSRLNYQCKSWLSHFMPMVSVNTRWKHQKISGLRPATLLKKSLWHRSFLLNFAKFLRTPFLQNTPGGCFWGFKSFVEILSKFRAEKLAYVAYVLTTTFIGLRVIWDMRTLTLTLTFSIWFFKVFKIFLVLIILCCLKAYCFIFDL